MKKILLLASILMTTSSFANGYNNNDLENISREAFVSLQLGCMVENEPPVITHLLMDNYITRSTLDFGFAVAVIEHGIDGVGIVSSSFKCK